MSPGTQLAWGETAFWESNCWPKSQGKAQVLPEGALAGEDDVALAECLIGAGQAGTAPYNKAIARDAIVRSMSRGVAGQVEQN